MSLKFAGYSDDSFNDQFARNQGQLELQAS